MLGPVEYIIVGFRGNNFDGSILKELKKTVDSGVIRVLDLLLLVKNRDGSVELAEVSDQSDDIREGAAELGFTGDLPLMTENDAAKIGALMENDTSAGVLVIEEVWAKGFKEALIAKNAVLIGEGRLHAENVNASVDDLAVVA